MCHVHRYYAKSESMRSYKTYMLEVDNKPNIRFEGSLVCAVSNKNSQSQQRVHLYLYKTAGGRYICYKRSFSQWESEVVLSTGAICKTFDDVIKYFGHDALALSLYEKANIVDVVE